MSLPATAMACAPSRVGTSIGDTLGGLVDSMAAFHARKRTGKLHFVYSTLYEAVQQMMEPVSPEYRIPSYIRESSTSFLLCIAPSSVY